MDGFSAGTDPVGGRAIGRSTSVNLFQGKLSHLFVCMPKKRNPKSHCFIMVFSLRSDLCNYCDKAEVKMRSAH